MLHPPPPLSPSTSALRAMGKFEKLTSKILSASSDKNIAFSDLLFVLKALGFDLRIRGDHHILTKPGIEEIINIQPIKSKAKAYQVKQVREIITRYHLLEDQ